MTVFDIIVLLIVAVAASGGFMRGFVQEILSLIGWIFTLAVIHELHTPLYGWLVMKIGNGPGAATLAFAMLLVVPIMSMRLIAGRFGGKARTSMLKPIDRVLGFGFGAVKGAIIVVCAFAILVLGYDATWGVAGRPDWIKQARTYPLVNASADALVDLINTRSSEVEQGDRAVKLDRA
ncbi:hypothetical protein GCM10011515_12130 [Tsuneonella deserti]|uniref:Colicin V production protein n=1 Tax=Tsuneonella deserti TaxID=2035528 RepID=A0ABQ1S7I6_9SPHN|nr:CvpA family protein [Tsuneonella deserti]GGD93888.1 hypothetical protein GCM10011515_12130 [Tsuneonella deserti]